MFSSYLSGWRLIVRDVINTFRKTDNQARISRYRVRGGRETRFPARFRGGGGRDDRNDGVVDETHEVAADFGTMRFPPETSGTSFIGPRLANRFDDFRRYGRVNVSRNGREQRCRRRDADRRRTGTVFGKTVVVHTARAPLRQRYAHAKRSRVIADGGERASNGDGGGGRGATGRVGVANDGTGGVATDDGVRKVWPRGTGSGAIDPTSVTMATVPNKSSATLQPPARRRNPALVPEPAPSRQRWRVPSFRD